MINRDHIGNSDSGRAVRLRILESKLGWIRIPMMVTIGSDLT
jgi:hypothetical protein